MPPRNRVGSWGSGVLAVNVGSTQKTRTRLPASMSSRGSLTWTRHWLPTGGSGMRRRLGGPKAPCDSGVGQGTLAVVVTGTGIPGLLAPGTLPLRSLVHAVLAAGLGDPGAVPTKTAPTARTSRNRGL